MYNVFSKPHYLVPSAAVNALCEVDDSETRSTKKKKATKKNCIDLNIFQ